MEKGTERVMRRELGRLTAIPDIAGTGPEQEISWGFEEQVVKWPGRWI